MSWDILIKQYKNYLQLERSLSGNSVEAYVHDVVKLKQFLEICNLKALPQQLGRKELEDFLRYLNELGMTEYTQARVLSGIRSFYKFLLLEEVVSDDPTALVEAPKLGRKLPDTLNPNEIDSILEALDLSTPEGARNRACLLYTSPSPRDS